MTTIKNTILMEIQRLEIDIRRAAIEHFGEYDKEKILQETAHDLDHKRFSEYGEIGTNQRNIATQKLACRLAVIHLEGAKKAINEEGIKGVIPLLIKTGYFLGAFNSVEHVLIENSIKDKERIKDRQDQIDKRAFQEAVTLNIADYTTKADAIRDLRIKPQFEKYGDNILRSWMSPDVWTKPTKRGAPKKK